jgi:hypothetical protein
MVHRNIRGTLFKIAYWVTAHGHYITQELVGFCHCPSRAVHEPSLHLAPRFQESCVIGRRERPDMETLHPLGALFELVFRSALVSTFSDSAGVFRAAKLRTQPRGAPISHENHRSDSGNHNHYETDDQSQLRCAQCAQVHDLPPFLLSFSDFGRGAALQGQRRYRQLALNRFATFLDLS